MSEEIKVEVKTEAKPTEVKDGGAESRSESTSVPTFTPLQSMLQVNNPTPEEQTQMTKIWDYFGKDNESTASRLYAIQNTINRMGQVSLGQSDLGKIYQWVTLRADIDDKEKLLNEL